MLSYLGNELLRVVRKRPLASVAVSPDRYSVDYSGVLYYVSGSGHEDVRVVLHVADAEVAAIAQEAAHLAGLVIVVNSPGAPGARFGGPADRAPAVLQREQPVVVGLRDAVQRLELDVSPVRV